MKVFVRQYGLWIVQLIFAGAILLNTFYIKDLLAKELRNYTTKSEFNDWKSLHKDWEFTTLEDIKSKLDLLVKLHLSNGNPHGK